MLWCGCGSSDDLESTRQGIRLVADLPGPDPPDSDPPWLGSTIADKCKHTDRAYAIHLPDRSATL